MTRSATARKRCFDLVIGVPLAFVAAPLVILLAPGPAVVYRANPLFRQTRVGSSERPFRFVKIRWIPPGIPETADKYALASTQNTAWGRLIRRLHVDELLQMWLVVTGKMSLVGPRPEMVDLSATFDPEFVRVRTSVPQGCTGLAQISTATARLINEATEFGEHYVSNWTMRLDIWLFARAALVVVGGSQIKDIGQIPTWTGAALVEPADALV